MNSLSDEMNIRVAQGEDIPELARHHCKMFEEIWTKKGKTLETKILEELEQAYAEKLREQFPAQACMAWVAEKKKTIVASCAVTIISFVPTPIDLSHRLAYLHSMYTEEEHRGRHYAHAIIDMALTYCKEMRIKRIILTASEAGRPIYHDIGFRPASDLMRLILENN